MITSTRKNLHNYIFIRYGKGSDLSLGKSDPSLTQEAIDDMKQTAEKNIEKEMLKLIKEDNYFTVQSYTYGLFFSSTIDYSVDPNSEMVYVDVPLSALAFDMIVAKIQMIAAENEQHTLIDEVFIATMLQRYFKGKRITEPLDSDSVPLCLNTYENWKTTVCTFSRPLQKLHFPYELVRDIKGYAEILE